MLEQNLKLPLEYKINYPKNEPKDVSIIFLLHGYGANMADLFLLHQFFPENFITISLQAPISLGHQSWAWSKIDFSDINTILNPIDSQNGNKLIIDSIDKIANNLSVKPNKIYLAGFSQGASLALYCGLKNPNKFQGVISLCGYFNKKHMSDIADDNFSGLNILVCNSVFDHLIPIELGRNTKNLLKSLGVNLKYNEYDSGHGISNECLNDFIGWIITK